MSKKHIDNLHKELSQLDLKELHDWKRSARATKFMFNAVGVALCMSMFYLHGFYMLVAGIIIFLLLPVAIGVDQVLDTINDYISNAEQRKNNQ